MKTQALDSIGALKGGTFWDFSTFLSQKLQQNWKRDLLLQKNSKKPTVAKKLEGRTHQSPPVLYVTRKKQNFLVQFARSNGSI